MSHRSRSRSGSDLRRRHRAHHQHGRARGRAGRSRPRRGHDAGRAGRDDALLGQPFGPVAGVGLEEQRVRRQRLAAGDLRRGLRAGHRCGGSDPDHRAAGHELGLHAGDVRDPRRRHGRRSVHRRRLRRRLRGLDQRRRGLPLARDARHGRPAVGHQPDTARVEQRSAAGLRSADRHLGDRHSPAAAGHQRAGRRGVQQQRRAVRLERPRARSATVDEPDSDDALPGQRDGSGSGPRLGRGEFR